MTTHEEKAREIADRWARPGWPMHKLLVAALTDALRAAERDALERAAKVAERMGGDFIECDAHGDGYREARGHIAQSIRDLANHTQERK